MFVEQIEFEVVPEWLAEWRVYVRTYLAALAREPGGVSFRILRNADAENRFISLRTWLSKDDAERSRQGPASRLAAKPSRDGGYYAGRPMVRTELGVIDMVWGLSGSGLFLDRRNFVQHLKSGFGPGKHDLWLPYVRNFGSVFARQPGVVALEILRSPAEAQRYIAVRTYACRDAARVGPEAQPADEVRLAVEAGMQRKVYEGGPGVVYTNCDVADAVWGAAGQEAYDRYMRGLKPA
jgi:quinol monooxygenase YgiN